MAPRKGGVTKEARMPFLIRLGKGISVRLTTQAITAPTTRDMLPTETASIIVMYIGL